MLKFCQPSRGLRVGGGVLLHSQPAAQNERGLPQFLKTSESSDAPAHILSNVPGVIRCFGSFNIRHPRPGDPASVDQAVTCVQVAFACPHGSPLLIQSHLEAFSAASVMFLMALLLAVPVMPRALKALWRECPTNPLLPTSMGIHVAFQPCARQSVTNWSYLVLFLS